MNNLYLLAVFIIVLGAMTLWFSDVHAHLEIDINKESIEKLKEPESNDNNRNKRKKQTLNIIISGIVEIIIGIILLLIEYNVFN